MYLDKGQTLRLLHVGKYFPPHYGGIETFMSQLMQEQAKDGVAVFAIVHQNYKSWQSKLKLWENCKVFFVKSFGQVLYAPISPAFPVSLFRVINTEKPHVVHVHMPNLSAFWLLLLPILSKVKPIIIIHWHSDVVGAVPDLKIKLMYPIYRLFERLLLNKARSIICTSPNYLSTSEPLQKYLNKCQVIPLGLSSVEKLVSVVGSSQAVVLKLTIIGRLTYYKGHELLIRAIYALRQKGIRVELNIVGRGELTDRIQNLCVEFELEKQVAFHGRVSDKQKFKILKNSDLLCLPSIERTEAFGMVLLEAAAIGIPSLVSNVEGSGMSYVVKDHVTGLIFENNSLESLVLKLQWASKNKLDLRMMGSAAFERYKSEFIMSNVHEKIKDVYREL